MKSFTPAIVKTGIAIVAHSKIAATVDHSVIGVSIYMHSPLVLPVGLEPTTERL